MGRYNFAAQNVHKHATQLLQTKRVSAPPPWYEAIGTTPPSARLTRPPLQRRQEPGAKQPKKRSRLFQPLNLRYEEDALRWEYFNDHPWELARPRVILENDGRDLEKWNWSLPLDYSLERPRVGAMDEFGRDAVKVWDENMATQSARPINGEAVIQRQQYLLRLGLRPAQAYDQARKELYRHRHAKEVEVRISREEALSTGAFFGPGPLEIGMELEDKAYEHWKVWAVKEIQSWKQFIGSAYTGVDEDVGMEIEEPEEEALQVSEVADEVPGSRDGQTARGGAAVHP